MEFAGGGDSLVVAVCAGARSVPRKARSRSPARKVVCCCSRFFMASFPFDPFD
jgi:hypothetical protein